MKNKHPLKMALIATACIALSCNQKSLSIPVLDFDNVSERNSIDLKLSDILDDITIVNLETTQDNLFSTWGGTPALITHTSIVIPTRDAVHQFNRDGKYHRQLIIRGKGPREFLYLSLCFVDEDADVLYYVDGRNRKEIYRIDLASGAFLDPIPMMDLKLLEVKLFKNNFLYGLPGLSPSGFDIGSNPDTSIIAFQYDIHAGSLKKYNGNKRYSTLPYGSSMVAYKNHLTIINRNYSDTLYQLLNNVLHTQFLVKLKNQMTNYREGGCEVKLLLEYDGGIIFTKDRFTYEETKDKQMIYPSEEHPFLLNNAGTLQRIRQVFIDPLQVAIQTESIESDASGYIDTPLYPFPKISGSYGYIFIEQEDSNPKIIIGKIK